MDTYPRAVVIVSGGDAISPFTTPTQACGWGQAAGSTDSGLRQALLAAGHAVFTSPANAGPGAAVEDPGFAGFAEAPEVLAPELTVNAVGPIDDAGVALAAFLTHLAEHYAVSSVDLVGHSMGGLFSRAAIRELSVTGSGPRIRSLITVGTPWQGSFTADYANGDLPLAAAGGDRGTETIMTEFKKLKEASSSGAGEQVTRRYLADPGGWNDQQAGVLDGVPVTLIGGDYFQLEGGDGRAWPHDGLVTLRSALALDVPDSVLPIRRTRAFPDVHSIYFAHQFDLVWETGLTWDPAVISLVLEALSPA